MVRGVNKEQWQGPFATETRAIEEFNKRYV